MVLNGFGVFADDVYTSTDLNRRSGEVLNHARTRPVTISRNNEQFALLKREQAARLVKVVNRVGIAVELLSEVNAALAGNTPSDEFSWLPIYDKDDLGKLFTEVLSAIKQAAMGHTDWDDVDALIYQWRESALVAQSGVLDSAVYSGSDEVPLPSPEQTASGSTENVRAACLNA